VDGREPIHRQNNSCTGNLYRGSSYVHRCNLH
jgi:hypothetical protein